MNPGAGSILVYFDVNGQLDDAIAKTRQHGGTVEQEKHAIGPYGCRAVVTDSGGNRIALHSFT